MRDTPRGRDHLIVWLARLLVRCFFRSVEVDGPPPPNGPVILAASHLNGFVDPVVLVGELRAFPRFLAKATLWNVWVARVLLDFARVIPVHRRADGDTGGNVGTFDRAVEALDDGDLLAVFPEGTTHDDPTLRPLRTGAARIAVQAAAAGVDDVALVPVGVTYEDKVRIRGRAVVSYGAPVAVPRDRPLLDPDGEPDHAVVQELTARLTADLRRLTPHFESAEVQLALQAAADTTLRADAPGGATPRFLAVTETARHLGDQDRDEVEALVSLVARYQMLLRSVGLDDEHLADGVSLTGLARRAVVLGVLLVLLAPLALAGLFANLIPLLLVLVAGLAVHAPVTKGTVRLLVALVAFPLTWIALAWVDATSGWIGETARQVTYPVDWIVGGSAADRAGWAANLLVLLAAPLLGAVALILGERLLAFLRTVERWRTLLDRRGQLGEVRSRRADVIERTHQLLGTPSDTAAATEVVAAP